MRELHRSSKLVLAFAIGVGLLSALRYLVGAGALPIAVALAILGVLALAWSGWRAVSFRAAGEVTQRDRGPHMPCADLGRPAPRHQRPLASPALPGSPSTLITG